MKLSITRRFEFDAAHRLPQHDGKCRFIHGHRYVLDVTLEGGVVSKVEDPSEGMLIDFVKLKTIVQNEVVDKWDHSLLLYENDPLLTEALTGQKIIKMSAIPTVENMAQEAFFLIRACLSNITDTARLRLRRVRLSETPNSWAEIED